jgi:uncharacterized protein (TIGR02118 family)
LDCALAQHPSLVVPCRHFCHYRGAAAMARMKCHKPINPGGSVMSVSKNPTQPRSTMSRRSALAFGAAAASALVVGAVPAQAAKAGGVKITVLYGAPKDPAAFETYYAEHHMPMVYKVKRIKRIELAKGLATPGAAAPAYYRVTELWFSSMAQMQKVTGTPQWKQIVDDVPNFASGGATIVVCAIG